MAPTDLSDKLAKLHMAHPSIVPQNVSSRPEVLSHISTLSTLPSEIKNDIFSNLLLGSKVKYSTGGSWPGHKYKFDTAVMCVDKQMKQDATAYLHGHNEFALIHTKFFAFEVDRRLFLPTVATGKAAKTFTHPAVESTITHLGTKCTCCPKKKHQVRDRVSHALFLVADRELCIAVSGSEKLPAMSRFQEGR